MRKPNLACAACFPLLALLHVPVLANPDMQTALSDCRDEAVSTGLENEVDIQYYVDLCMQSFAGMTGYGDAEYIAPPDGEQGEDTGSRQ